VIEVIYGAQLSAAEGGAAWTSRRSWRTGVSLTLPSPSEGERAAVRAERLSREGRAE